MARKETREEQLVKFYRKCRANACLNMKNETHQMKAKVFAADLKLKYRDIAVLFAEAKECYNKTQSELMAQQTKSLLEMNKPQAETVAPETNGTLLLTLYDRENDNANACTLQVYVRPNKSIYSIPNDGQIIEGSPAITVHKGGVAMMTYHPSQAVFIGATVGGVTTGGIHYTKAGYSISEGSSEKGYISVKYGDKSFVIELVTITEYTLKLFKRDGAYHALVNKRQIRCSADSEKSDFYAKGALSGKLDYATTMGALSVAADERRISYAQCVKIANLLGRILNGQFPPSDEEIYASADNLAIKARTPFELKEAIILFRSINGYNDARQRADDLQAKHDRLILEEKENAIRKKENRKGLLGFFRRNG